jgi:hypothetical protein
LRLAAKQQKVVIPIPEDLSRQQRELLAGEIVEHIRERSESGTGVRARGRGFSLYDFPGYSESYKASLDFRIAGKSSGSIDLTLSGDMLAAMDALRVSKSSITVGFEAGTEENARAEGNQIGSYGGSPNPRKARRFLGLTKSELDMLVERVRNG